MGDIGFITVAELVAPATLAHAAVAGAATAREIPGPVAGDHGVNGHGVAASGYFPPALRRLPGGADASEVLQRLAARHGMAAPRLVADVHSDHPANGTSVANGLALHGPTNGSASTAVIPNGVDHSLVPRLEAALAVEVSYAELAGQSLDRVEAEFTSLRLIREQALDGLLHEIDHLIAEQELLKPPGYNETWASVMAEIRAIDNRAARIEASKRLPKLTDPVRFKNINGDISRAVRRYQAVILESMRREGELVSWMVQRAVDVSPHDLSEFYQRLAMATTAFRLGMLVDHVAVEALHQKLTGEKRKKNALAAEPLFSAYQRRVQQLAWMTLPAEQQDPRGRFYDVDADLQALNLGHLREDLPDRIPLTPRRGHSPDDALLAAETEYAQMYDLSLRTALLVPYSGEVLDTDEAVVLLTHGVGTYSSTLGSLINWMNGMRNDSEGAKDASRRYAFIGFGEPAHGYGTRDPRFFEPAPLPPEVQERVDRYLTDLEAREARGEVESGTAQALRENLITIHTLAHPRIATDYLTAFRYRYGTYRARVGVVDRPLVVGGRSTGGRLAADHRIVTENTDASFDGYISMSAYPNASFFWRFYDWLYINQYIPAGQLNVLGISWFALLSGSNASLGELLSQQGALILSVVAGNDVDYPHSIPRQMDPSSEEIDLWVNDIVARLGAYFSHGEKWRPELLRHIFTTLWGNLRHLLEAVKPEDMTAEDYWQQIRAKEPGGLREFWHSGKHGRNDEGKQENDERELLFYHRGYHNALDSRNPRQVIEEARAAMLRFIELVRGDLRARRAIP